MIVEETLPRSVAEDIRAMDFMEKEEEIRRRREAERQTTHRRNSVTGEPMDLNQTQRTVVDTSGEGESILDANSESLTMGWESTTAIHLLGQGGIRDHPGMKCLSIIPAAGGKTALNVRNKGAEVEAGTRTRWPDERVTLYDIRKILKDIKEENRAVIARMDGQHTRLDEQCAGSGEALKKNMFRTLQRVATEIEENTDRKIVTMREAICDEQRPTNDLTQVSSKLRTYQANLPRR